MSDEDVRRTETAGDAGAGKAPSAAAPSDPPDPEAIDRPDPEASGGVEHAEDPDSKLRAMLGRVRGALSRGADEAAERTEERYARALADRLSPAMLAEHRARVPRSTEAAFFDLDKTIIARSSTLMMGRTFFRDGLISPANVVRGLYAQVVYQLVGADHAKMEQMRAALLDLTTGWDADRVATLAAETVEELMVPLVYQEALDLFEEHRAAGRDIWIISSSGEEIVRPIARYLGVGNFIATRAGVDQAGRYDGTLEFYAYGKAKANAIRQLADELGYDLDRCHAYSDSITDLPMLGLVGHPVVVNPDRELRAAAQAMEWDVRDFVAPVSLRSRLPDVSRPSNDVVIAGAAVALVALLAWRLLRDDEPGG